MQRSRPRKEELDSSPSTVASLVGSWNKELVWLGSGHRREGPITRDMSQNKDMCQLLQGLWLLLRMRWESAARFKAKDMSGCWHEARAWQGPGQEWGDQVEGHIK